jgi:hypothetical protein
VICFQLAPMARIRASSRARWATTMLNVLKIRKMPTITATMPNGPKKYVLSCDSPSLTSFAWSSLACSPVFASKPAGTSDVTRSRSASCETPSSAERNAPV